MHSRSRPRRPTKTGKGDTFRKNGTRMRAGYFDKGVQVGRWTTYDAKGNVHKVTQMKPRRTA